MVISGAATRGGNEVELEVVVGACDEEFVLMDVDIGKEEEDEVLVAVDKVVGREVDPEEPDDDVELEPLVEDDEPDSAELGFDPKEVPVDEIPETVPVISGRLKGT
jgi:hypothetical protein